MAIEMTLKAALNREKDIQEELERLEAKETKTEDDRAAVPKLLEEFRDVHQYRLDQEHDLALAEVRSAVGGAKPVPVKDDKDETRNGDVEIVDRRYEGPSLVHRKYRNPWDTSEVRWGNKGTASELQERALDCIERMPYADDKVRNVCAKFVERERPAGMSRAGRMAEMVLHTTSPEYMDAFCNILRSNDRLAALMPNEQAALQRAMTLVDTAGGYLVPFQLDPSVILTAAGSFNQVRQISRVVQATGDVWNGVSSAGVTGSWDTEAQEVSDDSPTLAQPTIPIHKLQIFVQASYEVAADAPSLAGEVATMIAEEKDRLESVAFVTGTGTGQPTGIVTALLAAAPTVTINSAAADTFAVGDVYALDGALPARWASRASWLAGRPIYNLIRRFDTSGGAALWGYLADGRKTELLGRPDYVAEAMDSSITALAANPVLIFGDFSNYVIADRLGTTLQYIPWMTGAAGRPTGQVGWHAYARCGADSVNDAAFRLLDVT